MDEALTRICSRCGQEKPVRHFEVRPHSSRPARTVCGSCRGKVQRGQLPPVGAPQQPVTPPESPLRAAQQAHARATSARNLKAEHRALLEENARLHALVDQAAKVQAPSFIVYEERADLRSDATACVIASDWHIEEPVEPESINGLNAFDLDVARARAENFFRNSLRLALIFAREQRITTIDIQVLGDMFSGWIHEELIANTLLAPGAAATEFARIFASGINFILSNSDLRVSGLMIPGNHGRLTNKVHINNPTGTSLETVAYHAIADKFEGNPRVKLDIARHGFVYRKFYERFIVRHIHGYEVKYGGGIGGLTVPLNKKIARWDTATPAKLTVLGHFHSKFDGGNFLVNGSLIGYNQFAQAIGAPYEPAQQVFYLIDARNGGEKTVVAPVFV